jgi:hypothetical protein
VCVTRKATRYCQRVLELCLHKSHHFIVPGLCVEVLPEAEITSSDAIISNQQIGWKWP